MCKAEVQSLVSLVRGGSKIVLLLLRRHCVPGLFSLRIHTHVEELRADKDKDIVHADTDEHPVAAAVERLVVVTVDLGYVRRRILKEAFATYIRGNDRASLNGHVVQR